MNLEDLYRLLRSGHVQAQGVMDTLDEPLLVLDQSLCVVTANPAFLRVFDTDRDQTIGHALFSLGNGQWDIPDLRQLLSSIIPRATAVVDYEVTHEFPHIGTRTILITARRLAHPDDNSHQILIVFHDVTERRHDDEAKDILLNETRHRMKNLVSVIRALANRTRTEGLSANEYRDAFIGRLQGLLVAQELSLGETRTVDLKTLIERVLAPYAEQIDIEAGPSFQISRRQVQPLGMVLHELATNAVKYGSLSVPQGRVRLSWSNELRGEQCMLSIVWVEENGPPVSQPDHEGFGADMIRHSIGDIEGHVDLAYNSGGLRACMTFPVTIVDT